LIEIEKQEKLTVAQADGAKESEKCQPFWFTILTGLPTQETLKNHELVEEWPTL
jgi:hypothetical protein